MEEYDGMDELRSRRDDLPEVRDEILEDKEDIYGWHDVRFVVPCPFCGSLHIHHESGLVNGGGWRNARCDNCGATGGYVSSFEDAPFTKEMVVKRWNTRV